VSTGTSVGIIVVGGIIILTELGDICYSGYVANENGCSVGQFCWQVSAKYVYYCNPWNWNWAR